MKKNISCIMLSLLVVAILSVPITGAFATKPVYVSATGGAAIVPVPVKTAGGNTFFDVTGAGSYTGDLVGTTEGVHRWHQNKDGKTNLFIELVFTGSVLGESGSINLLCTGKMGGKVTWSIISGTGELANLRGTGTLGPGWIEGYVHFDP